MKYPIKHVIDIGNVVRAVRKESGMRQDDVAGSVGVSHVYLRDLERGKETAQIGRALQVLAELGIRMELEIPSAAYQRLVGAKPRSTGSSGVDKRSPSVKTREKPAGRSDKTNE
ncbi:MAG: helix-turn-helix domain-containing protein [Pseudomonadota bacterium]